jgi:hypothetical protein
MKGVISSSFVLLEYLSTYLGKEAARCEIFCSLLRLRILGSFRCCCHSFICWWVSIYLDECKSGNEIHLLDQGRLFHQENSILLVSFKEFSAWHHCCDLDYEQAISWSSYPKATQQKSKILWEATICPILQQNLPRIRRPLAHIFITCPVALGY